MSAKWDISIWPGLAFHAFLSHCAEDRNRLVWPTYRRLQDLRIIPWFDQNDYPIAEDPFAALRDQLVLCRHVVYFITPALLKQGRGWCAVERTYSELIQRHFSHVATSMWSFELPLIFLPRTPESLKTIQKSAWCNLIPKAVWFDQRSQRRLTRIEWSVQQISRLIHQQNQQAQALAQRLLHDQPLAGHLEQSIGLRDRVTSLLPRVHSQPLG